MWRVLLFAGLIAVARADDAPPIAITSPDEASTYPYGSVKSHTLSWDKKRQLFIVRLVFVDVNPGPQDPDDSHDFRLPGVSYDAAKKLFYATSARGEVIPIAKYRQELFFKAIQMLPNAAVRIQHPHGHVTVILEALKPDDPALKPPPPATNADGTPQGHTIDLHDLIH